MKNEVWEQTKVKKKKKEKKSKRSCLQEIIQKNASFYTSQWKTTDGMPTKMGEEGYELEVNLYLNNTTCTYEKLNSD